MLAASKMTGLDLVSSNAAAASMASKNSDTESVGKRSSTSSEEMLMTPKLIPDSASALTPHFSRTASGLPSHGGGMTTSASEAMTTTSGSTLFSNGLHNDSSDMLTTPVMTTPKLDMWSPPPHLRAIFGTSSPDPRGLASSADLQPREPPKDLPLDSDIGLRSPCEGIVAKRREKFRKSKQHSENSCDTNSENSPRDMSVAKLISEEPKTPILTRRSPSPPLAPNFKQPHKPESLRLPRVEGSSGAEPPAHYTPSPLAVPSPNWMVVERYFEAGSLLKTPKQLDSTVFDFLTPATPRSAKLFPGGRGGPGDDDRYSRLSPRHSPRLTIPETPTDLSSRGLLASPRLHKPEFEDNEAAEDLSIAKPTSLQHDKPLGDFPSAAIKQEFHPRIGSPPLHVQPNILVASEAIKSEIPHLHQQHVHPPTSLTASDLGSLASSSSDYEFRMSHQGYHGLSSAAAAMVYRQMYNMQRSSAAVTSRPSSTASDYRDLHNSSPSNYQLPPQGSSSWPQTWPPPPPGSTTSEVMNEDDSSVSPPHFSSPVKHPKSDLEVKRSSTPGGKKRGSTSAASAGKSKKQKEANAGGSGEGGAKRVYSCPHCQRSYDWNYNLNRHLKYECGKENAFQCAKCGRKFPHKQNCVYHLKRKHKIVCDTIDQYMSNGLVIFRGSNNPGGQQVANPQPP